MPHDRGGTHSADEWIRYAEADLNLARVPLPEGVLYEQMCFHAQQAGEKSLKAVLIHLGVTFPHSHDLGLLLSLIPSSVPLTARLITAATQLTAYAVSFRYPGAYEPVDEQEYLAAVCAAETVCSWSRRLVAGCG